MVQALVGGLQVGTDYSQIRPPSELHVPFMHPPIDELYTASLLEGLSQGTDAARRFGGAIDWLDIAWRNTASIDEDTRIIALRAGFEVLLAAGDKTNAIREALCGLLDPGLLSICLEPVREPLRGGGPVVVAVSCLGRFGSDDQYPRQPGGFSVFSQWKACSTCPIHTVVTGNAPDGFNDYIVKYNSQTGKIEMFKNFTLVDQTFNFDAAVSWTAPWIPEFAAETKNPNTDIVGVASGHAKFNELRQVSRTGAFSIINGIAAAERNSVFRYHTDASGLPGRFEVWTDPL
jgi:hypothetical protein